MKKRTVKIGILLFFVVLATIGTKLADNDKISSFGLMFSNLECGFSFSGGRRPYRLLVPAAGFGRLFPGLNGLGGNGFGAAIIVKY